jgi:porphobilinogen synthase
VSGEYSLINNGIKKGIINNSAILESLISFKRAGASAIVSYYADKIAKNLR